MFFGPRQEKSKRASPFLLQVVRARDSMPYSEIRIRFQIELLLNEGRFNRQDAYSLFNCLDLRATRTGSRTGRYALLRIHEGSTKHAIGRVALPASRRFSASSAHVEGMETGSGRAWGRAGYRRPPQDPRHIKTCSQSLLRN